jgi:PEP-CTERM motif
MKYGLSVCLLALGSASAYASACTSGATLASLITTGSCTFSGSGQTYTLNNLTFVALGVLAQTSTASDITVTESIGPTGPSINFTPDTKLDALSGLASSLTYLFGFDLVSNQTNIGFSAVNLSEQSNLSGLVSVGAVAEQDCYGGLLPVGLLSLGDGGLVCLGGGLSVGASLALTPAVGANASVPIQFTGFSNSVDVLKEIDLTSALGGSASVTGIGQSFTTINQSAVPEPTTMFLGGCGLIGLAFFRRRRAQ